MGDPAQPPPSDRAEARRVSAAILEAVRSDESVAKAAGLVRYRPDGYQTFHLESDVHSLLTALAMEVELMAGERDRLRAAVWAVIDMFEGACANFDSRGKGGQHVPYHGEFSTMTPSTRNQLGRWSYDLRQALSNTWPMTRDEFVAMFPDTPTDALDHMFKERQP
jgi:hypothetical protein